jgi:SAM-dependent methyltransferase
MAAVGFYEQKQLLSPSRILRWSHGQRFAEAVQMAERLGGRALLDYGCGDGTFLAKVSHAVERCVGADLAPQDVSRGPSIPIVAIDELDESHNGVYDLVFCMEVLEHCTPTSEEKVLSDLRRLVAPHGVVVISVPIEIGASLFVKQTVRHWLGKKKVSDYEWYETYPLGVLVKMIFAGEHTSIERPIYGEGGDGVPHHSHYGFNWRALSRRIGERFVVEERRFSPLGWTRGFASSQAWFVCRPR